MSSELKGDNVYRFKCGGEVYEYKTCNSRKYTNKEFMLCYLFGFTKYGYYHEPCTMENDYDGWLVMFPRSEDNDKEFLKNVKIILENTKSNKVRKIINKILNHCFIIDKEPVIEGDVFMSRKRLNMQAIKEWGEYHIDGHRLKDYYRDTINFSAHKYIKKYYKDHYDEEEQDEINTLTNGE